MLKEHLKGHHCAYNAEVHAILCAWLREISSSSLMLTLCVGGGGDYFQKWGYIKEKDIPSFQKITAHMWIFYVIEIIALEAKLFNSLSYVVCIFPLIEMYDFD